MQLKAASMTGNADSFKDLLKAGADINIKDNDGKTVMAQLDELEKKDPSKAAKVQKLRKALADSHMHKLAAKADPKLGGVSLKENSPEGTLAPSAKDGARPAAVQRDRASQQ